VETPVNPHYLEHVMTTSRKREIEASQDIVSDNGMKLLAKGTRIDESVKERLLEHKLRQPLEDCMKVAAGVSGPFMAAMAESLLDDHLMLRQLYKSGRHAPLSELRNSLIGGAMESMLTIYAEHAEQKLEHAVGTSLLCMGLSRQLCGDDATHTRTAMLAGLCHDVGELYIDPAFLQKGVKLGPAQWKHVAAHPIVAHRLLKDMPKVGPKVASAVLGHHERLDGFGYPFGLSGDQVTVASQVLAVGELLIGLLESRRTPLRAAEVAVKLIPGEFSRAMIDAVSALGREGIDDETATAKLPSMEELVSGIARVTKEVQRIDGIKAQIGEAMADASAPFQALLEQVVTRHDRIHRAFSSTGMDSAGFEGLLQSLSAEGDNSLALETMLVMREVTWRYRELVREMRTRVDRSMPGETERLERLLGLIDPATERESRPAELAA
jgi:hypothetical protein